MGFIKAKAVSQQLLCFYGPGIFTLRAHDYSDQTHIITGGGCNQAVSGIFCEAGFHAIDVSILE